MRAKGVRGCGHLFRRHEAGDASGRLWTVVFEGEAAEDAGGPFRESLAQAADELMGDAAGAAARPPARLPRRPHGADRFGLI